MFAAKSSIVAVAGLGAKLYDLPSISTEKFLKSVTDALLENFTSPITAKLLFVEVGVPIDAAALVRETELITRLEVAEVMSS